MQNAVTRTPPPVKPIPPGAPYVPTPYLAANDPDPFRQSRLYGDDGVKVEIVAKLTGQPDFKAKEARNNILESYPLSSIKMVGYLVLNNKVMAAVQVENFLKQVKVGDYIGTDFGEVKRVEEHQITVLEKVKDVNGEWTDRTVFIPMKTAAKKLQDN